MQTIAERSTVHVGTKHRRDSLPPQQHLRRFLRIFGKILSLYEWCSEGADNLRPNNALVMFETPVIAQNVLADSALQASGSFWITQSLVAHPLKPELRETFDNRLNSSRHSDWVGDSTSNSTGASGSRTAFDNPRADRRRTFPNYTETEHPSKRPRRASPPSPSEPNHVNPVNYNSNSASTSSHAASPRLASTEWMQARIKHLESELSASNAARDLALSEKDIAVKSYEIEQQARREAISQKSVIESALSCAETEQTRLLAELDKPPRPDFSEEIEKLRNQLKLTETKLLEVRANIGDSAEERDARIKRLEFELEEAHDQAHKLRIQKTQLEQSGNEPIALLQEAREQIERLRDELDETQEQLECAQQSLEKSHLKYSNERSKHKVTKEKLADYKTRLQENSAISEQLRGTAPAAFETLKAVMCAMGLPPIGDQGQVLTPKTETE